MFILSLVATLAAAYFSKEAYNDNKIGWAMFWAGLLGWDIHSLLNYI